MGSFQLPAGGEQERSERQAAGTRQSGEINQIQQQKKDVRRRKTARGEEKAKREKKREKKRGRA